jgi:hypothetical protein
MRPDCLLCQNAAAFNFPAENTVLYLFNESLGQPDCRGCPGSMAEQFHVYRFRILSRT